MKAECPGVSKGTLKDQEMRSSVGVSQGQRQRFQVSQVRSNLDPLPPACPHFAHHPPVWENTWKVQGWGCGAGKARGRDTQYSFQICRQAVLIHIDGMDRSTCAELDILVRRQRVGRSRVNHANFTIHCIIGLARV